MLRFEVDADDLVHSRFALSPAFELGCLLRLLPSGSRRLPDGWAARVRPAYQRLRKETALDSVLVAPRHCMSHIRSPPRKRLRNSWEDHVHRCS